MKKKVSQSALKQYIQLTSSTLIMTALQFVVSIMLTRLMAPQEYATYKLILNTNLLLQGLLTFGIPITLSFLLAKDSEKAAKYIGAGIKIALVSSLIGTVVCFGLLLIQKGTGLNIVDNTALYFAPICFIPILFYYTEYICIGTNDIKLLSKQKAFVQVLMVTLLLLCWLVFAKINLFISIVVYSLSSVIMIIYLCIKLKTDLKTSGMIREIFAANKTLGLQTYIGALFSIVSTRALNVIVDTYITKSEYALFSLAITISAPMGPFISTIGSVMFKRFNQYNEMGKRFITMISGITALSAVVYVLGIRFLTPVIFGEFYRGSIVYSQVLGVGALMVGLGDVFNRFIVVKGKGKYIRNSAIAAGIVNIVIATLLITSMKAVGVTISTVASNITYLLFMIGSYVIVVRELKNNPIEFQNH